MKSKTSQEGCTKLAHVKIYNSIVLEKEELWIFIFWAFLSIWKTVFPLIVSKWIMKAVLFAVTGDVTKKVCLSHLSVCCLKSKPVYTSLLDSCNTVNTYICLCALKIALICFQGRVTKHHKSLHFSAAAILALYAGVRIRCSQCQLIFDLWMFEFVVFRGQQRQCNVNLSTSARFSSAFSETRKLPILFFELERSNQDYLKNGKARSVL